MITPFGNPAIAVAAIGVIALVLSAITYQFFNDAADKIVQASAQEARTAARVQAHDLANSLENRFQATLGALQVIANSPIVQDGDVQGAKALFQHAQGADDDMTDFYGWLDKNGRIIWTTFVEENADNARFLGADRSDTEWFVKARDTRSTYASYAISSLDNIDRLFLSHPIIDQQTGEFEGVLYSGISLQKLNTYLEDQLFLGIDTTTGLLDLNGVILHAKYPELVGLNYFSDEYQSMINSAPVKVDDRDALERFITQSLKNGGEGSADFAYSGTMATTAYSPVTVDNQRFMMMYTRVPHIVAGAVFDLVSQQRVASWLLIGIIGAVAASMAFLTISWNKRLESTVAERTEELNARTMDLEKANRNLVETTDDLRSAFTSLAENNEKLRRANEQLLRNDKMQQEFINIAAHELRTPVQPLLGVADLLLDSQVKSKSGEAKIEVSKPEIEMIIRNAKRLERLSSDILQVSRIESNSLKLNKERVELKEIASQAIKDLRVTIPAEKDIQFVIKPDQDPVFVKADRERIFEVLSNLLSNAIKFTQEGSIIVSLDASNNEVTVKVSDTGSGIDPEIMPRLFTKFASRSVSQGTGLGLYISKSIIEAHGGKIWAENNKDGIGATFSFTLPLDT